MDFLRTLRRNVPAVSWTLGQHAAEHGGYEEELSRLMGDILPQYLFELDKKVLIREFTVGFHVEARRLPTCL